MMEIKDKIQCKSRINVDEVISRLKGELKVSENGKEQLSYSLYATLQLILSITNRICLIEDMYSIWIDMTKDYWKLNGYEKKYNSAINSEQENSNKSNNIKSIKRGDTETTFVDEQNQIEIDGVKYQTGTIEYDEDILLNKYKKRLYKFRLLGRRHSLYA